MTHTEQRERRLKIAQYVRGGSTTAEAARKFGLSLSLVTQACRVEGVTRPERTANRRRAIAEYVRRGGTIADACAKFGLALCTVTNACKEHGVQYPRKAWVRFRVRGAVLHILAAMFDRRRTQTSIATQFNVSKQRVSQVAIEARKAGIPLPDRRDK